MNTVSQVIASNSINHANSFYLNEFAFSSKITIIIFISFFEYNLHSKYDNLQ